MRRVLLGFAVCVGTLVIGATNASAAAYCSDDPTLGVGLPVHYSVNVKVSGAGVLGYVYASGTSQTTTFGFVAGLR